MNLDFIGWGVHKQTYLDNTLDAAKPIPALSFGTANKYGTRRSPRPGSQTARATGC